MTEKLNTIKIRYWIITIYLLTAFVGLMGLRTYTQNYVQSTFSNSDFLSIYIGATWTIFSNFGIYLIIISLIPLVGLIISKRLKKQEAIIAFKFLSIIIIAFLLLFILYWLTVN